GPDDQADHEDHQRLRGHEPPRMTQRSPEEHVVEHGRLELDTWYDGGERRRHLVEARCREADQRDAAGELIGGNRTGETAPGADGGDRPGRTEKVEPELPRAVDGQLERSRAR